MPLHKKYILMVFGCLTKLKNVLVIQMPSESEYRTHVHYLHPVTGMKMALTIEHTHTQTVTKQKETKISRPNYNC